MANEIEMCICGTEVRFDENNICPTCGGQIKTEEGEE